MTAKQKEGQSFEKSIERLEKIVADMESGSLSLEDMIARFEEGQALIKLCSRKLNEVEKKVEVLVQKNGKLAVEDMDVEPETDGSKTDELF